MFIHGSAEGGSSWFVMVMESDMECELIQFIGGADDVPTHFAYYKEYFECMAGSSHFKMLYLFLWLPEHQ
jgi:hypothetical protein